MCLTKERASFHIQVKLFFVGELIVTHTQVGRRSFAYSETLLFDDGGEFSFCTMERSGGGNAGFCNSIVLGVCLELCGFIWVLILVLRHVGFLRIKEAVVNNFVMNVILCLLLNSGSSCCL